MSEGHTNIDASRCSGGLPQIRPSCSCLRAYVGTPTLTVTHDLHPNLPNRMPCASQSVQRCGLARTPESAVHILSAPATTRRLPVAHVQSAESMLLSLCCAVPSSWLSFHGWDASSGLWQQSAGNPLLQAFSPPHPRTSPPEWPSISDASVDEVDEPVPTGIHLAHPWLRVSRHRVNGWELYELLSKLPTTQASL